MLHFIFASLPSLSGWVKRSRHSSRVFGVRLVGESRGPRCGGGCGGGDRLSGVSAPSFEEDQDASIERTGRDKSNHRTRRKKGRHYFRWRRSEIGCRHSIERFRRHDCVAQIERNVPERINRRRNAPHGEREIKRKKKRAKRYINSLAFLTYDVRLKLTCAQFFNDAFGFERRASVVLVT